MLLQADSAGVLHHNFSSMPKDILQ